VRPKPHYPNFYKIYKMNICKLVLLDTALAFMIHAKYRKRVQVPRVYAAHWVGRQFSG